MKMSEEKYGVESLKGLAGALGEVVAIAYKLIVEKGGLFAALFQVQGPLSFLQKFFTAEGLVKAKNEALDLSEAESKELGLALLAPMPAALQSKLAPVENLFSKVVSLVSRSVNFAKFGVAEAKLIVAEFKAVFGV